MTFNNFISLLHDYKYDLKEDFQVFELNIYTNTLLEKSFVDTFFNSTKKGDNRRVEADYADSELGFDPDKIFTSSEDTLDWEKHLSTLVEDGSTARIKFTINKQIKDNTLAIYSLTHFTDYLDKNLKALLNILQDWILSKGIKNLQVQNKNDVIYFQSNLFSITSINVPELASTTITEDFRNKIVFRRDKYTNPHNLGGYSLVPSDFHHTLITKSIIEQQELLYIFQKLKHILSLSFISNTSRVEGENFEASIFDDDFFHMNESYKKIAIIKGDILYDIYHWIYEDEFSLEKLTIARPIIARNFNLHSNEWIIDQNTHKSIKSAYTIFLKKNVEQYFQTVSKATDLAADILMKNREIVAFAASSFKGNNLAILGYFISIFIFNSLSTEYHSPIFNQEKYYISLTFILISTLYFFVSYRQFLYDITNSEEHFNEIKKMFSEPLLVAEDLDKIFNQSNFNNKIKKTKEQSEHYFYLWFIEILILYTLVVLLTYFNI